MHYLKFLSRALLTVGILFNCSNLHAEAINLLPQNFIETASFKSASEVEMAKVAIQKSGSLAVANFAREMLSESTNRLNSLRVFAKENELAILTDAELEASAHKYVFERRGQSFDSAYVAMRVIERKKLVMLYRAAINSSDPNLKYYAEAHLSELMRELYMAQKLADSVKSSAILIAENP